MIRYFFLFILPLIKFTYWFIGSIFALFISLYLWDYQKKRLKNTSLAKIIFFVSLAIVIFMMASAIIEFRGFPGFGSGFS